MLPFESARQTLINAARQFYQHGWLWGTSGNLSLRLTDDVSSDWTYLITASGCDKGQLTLNDFVQMRAPMTVLSPADGKGSAETLLHEMIYSRFPEAKAVYHVHPIAAGVLSMVAADQPELLTFSGLEMLKGLGYPTHDVTLTLPCIENHQDMTVLRDQLEPLLDEQVPGFLLRGHGLYAWGNSAFEAKRHIEIWQYLLSYQLEMHQLSAKRVPPVVAGR